MFMGEIQAKADFRDIMEACESVLNARGARSTVRRSVLNRSTSAQRAGPADLPGAKRIKAEGDSAP